MKPHLWFIRRIGVIVPRRLRADWRQEWEAELRYRERLLAEWDRLDWRHKLELMRRSTSAFWDALWLQPRRLEDEMFQDVPRPGFYPRHFADHRSTGRTGSGAKLTTVIGVGGDIRHQGLDRQSEGAVYLGYRQLPRPGMSLVLRCAVEPLGLAPALRAAVREVDPALPVYQVMTMDERLSNSVAARRFNLLILGAFAALALLLAGVGVYGVIAYVVTQRTHEVGIRMALGAQSADVLRLFIRQGMAQVLLGVGLGLLGAFALTREMTSLLFGVSANDPLTFAGVALLLLLIARLACYLPARRATRIDPLVALRHQ